MCPQPVLYWKALLFSVQPLRGFPVLKKHNLDTVTSASLKDDLTRSLKPKIFVSLRNTAGLPLAYCPDSGL